MKANYELCLSGGKCIFVPYRPEHLPIYHEWMQDAFLLEATASEPLSMDEEIEMQREWRDDEKKCTFIILARDLLPEGISTIPPPPAESEIGHLEKKSYPQLVEQTLGAMIGDVNLFLSEEELEESDDERNKQTSQSTQAELDLMIAAASHRHKNLGTELALMMMHYGAKNLRIRRFFCKIKDTNNSSLKLFKEKLGFVQCAYAECFGEYEVECRCESSEEMTTWVETKWEGLCRKTVNGPTVAGADGEGCSDGQCRHPCAIYNAYKCPLSSSA